MTTIIIGSGITGLSAGYHIDDGVIIIERDYALGGLCSSYYVEGEHGYHIEKFYHHLFEQDCELISLCKKLDIEIEWRIGIVGYSFNNKIYPLNTPLEILKYPYLNLFEKLKLAQFTLKCKKEDPKKHAGEAATDYIIKNVGVPTYEKFFLPLLRGKFGEDYLDISAAWLISRIKLRSNRTSKGERLGYLRGGFQKLVDALANKIEKKGGKILNGTNVREIVVENGIVKSVITENEIIKTDKIICTSPGLTAKYFGMKKVLFQGAFCTLFSLKKKISDIYWLNIADNLSFKALIEHTNFMPLEDYGENLVYAVTYTSKPIDIEKTLKLFMSDLEKFGIGEEDIIWQRTSYEMFAAPLYSRTYTHLPYKSGAKGLYFAGIFSKPNYPERSINGSIKAGKEVAEFINNG